MRCFFLFFIVSGVLFGAISLDDLCVTLDLRNPKYRDGVLMTEEGGVVSGSNVRIQARQFFIYYDEKIISNHIDIRKT